MCYRVFFAMIDFADADCDISFFIIHINEHFPMGSMRRIQLTRLFYNLWLLAILLDISRGLRREQDIQFLYH